MRLVSWNLHGAFRSRAGLEKQHRAWAHLRDLGADVVLAQEVSDGGIPAWAKDEWTILAGEQGRGRKTWRWGSVIAARPGLNPYSQYGGQTGMALIALAIFGGASLCTAAVLLARLDRQ